MTLRALWRRYLRWSRRHAAQAPGCVSREALLAAVRRSGRERRRLEAMPAGGDAGVVVVPDKGRPVLWRGWTCR